ncbi:hypothetical protein K501DRAFT_279153 [Backusella circina FSU 941]|nr:hypothetical protein K501DRAFT_279153 [Backusella circina FSU 941]
MNIRILLFGIFIGILAQQANALCQCPEGDIACLQGCVDKTNTCITSCGSNIVCYNACIQDSWPGQTLTTTSNNIATSTTISQMRSSPASSAVTSNTNSRITVAPTSTSIPTSNSNIPSSIPGGSTAISKVPISGSDRPIPTYPEFSPKPPTSSTAPPPSSGSSKSLLVPGVAIGVAMVTVIVQLFFLARMGTILFHS